MSGEHKLTAGQHFPFPTQICGFRSNFTKDNLWGKKGGKPLFLYDTDFFFSCLREHLSSPCRPSSHLILTKDTEWETRTHTRNVPHQKRAMEFGCCLPALDTSSSRGFVKYLFSLAIYFVLCATGKEMQCMLQKKTDPTLTQTSLKAFVWNLDAEKAQ